MEERVRLLSPSAAGVQSSFREAARRNTAGQRRKQSVEKNSGLVL